MVAPHQGVRDQGGVRQRLWISALRNLASPMAASGQKHRFSSRRTESGSIRIAAEVEHHGKPARRRSRRNKQPQLLRLRFACHRSCDSGRRPTKSCFIDLWETDSQQKLVEMLTFCGADA
jgi:hypothetical protein